MKLVRVPFAILMIAMLTKSAFCADAPAVTNEPSPGNGEVRRWIEQLGSNEFVLREQAEQKLLDLGDEAFDALEEAQHHTDLEIGMRAQYLLRRFHVSPDDADPPEVRRLVRAYASIKDAEKKIALVGQLARLPEQAGWLALCRIVRFDPNEALSKRTALALLTQASATERSSEKGAEISKAVATSRRPAAAWLKTFGEELALSPEKRSPATWKGYVENEFALLHEAQQSSRTSPEIARLFTHWYVETFRSQVPELEIDGWVTRLAELNGADPRRLAEHVDWLAHVEMWKWIVELEKQAAAPFAGSPILLYRLAEAQLKLGQTEIAAVTAEKALQITGEDSRKHLESAQALAQRGLFQWAEGEFRYIIKASNAGAPIELFIRSSLAEMLHDQGRDIDAATALQEFYDFLEKNPKSRELLNGFDDRLDSARSRMLYFSALTLIEKQDFVTAETKLWEALEDDPENVDVLISLYRLPKASEETQQRTRKQIREASQRYLNEIAEQQRTLARLEAQQHEEVSEYRKELAKSLNQYAWLIGNTEGDREAAVQCSHQSLQLFPNQAAYLDTLARAYYGKGDAASAVKYQKEALRLEPFSGQMRRQLAFFEKELATKSERK